MSTLELKARKTDLFEIIMSINDEDVINKLWVSIEGIIKDSENFTNREEISHQKVLNGLEQFESGQYTQRTAEQTQKMLEL